MNGDDPGFAEIYNQLRRLAQRMLDGERTGHTLQATALVHEAWLSLRSWGTAVPADPPRFQRMAAAAMRHLLVEHARRRGRRKRGGGAGRLPLDALELIGCGHDQDVLEMNEALDELGRREPELAELVQLRFFAGLSIEQVAQVLGSSVRTVHRDWAIAKALLARLLPADS